MRRVLVLFGLLAVVALASSVGVTTSAQAATMCTTSCSVATLSCNPVNSCTSVPGTSITCDGVTTQCSTADAYCSCIAPCIANHDNCSETCNRPITCRICDNTYNTC